VDEEVNAVAPLPAICPVLSCVALDVAVADRRLVRDLTLTIEPGTVTCILGCNGAGKTLTLHTLAGIRAPNGGRIVIGDRHLGDWPRKVLARELGLLTQHTDDPFPSSVLESVLIGRHPHIDFWQWENEDDKNVARAALAIVGLSEFEARDIGTLSGGERRRAAIATLLAQDPKLLLLDEPINHLDPHHQIEVLRLMRARAASGRTVIMSLHDAGLATRFADHALLLFGNGDWQFGPVNETLNEDSISRLYGMRVQEVKWPGGRVFAPSE
jgi:iron complex transport system ATP-binding protein